MVNVKENLERIEQNITVMTKRIDELKESVKFTEEEVERLRGCLVVFKCLDGAGVENIETSVKIEKSDFEFRCTKDEKMENVIESSHDHGHGDDHGHRHDHGHGHGHGHSHNFDNTHNEDPILRDKPVDKNYQSYCVI
jgi:hypothetical protein